MNSIIYISCGVENNLDKKILKQNHKLHIALGAIEKGHRIGVVLVWYNICFRLERAKTSIQIQYITKQLQIQS